MMRPPPPHWINTPARLPEPHYPVAFAHRSATGSMTAIQTEVPASVFIAGCVAVGFGIGVGIVAAERRRR